MSSIYIQEPPTSGKVVLETTVGDIDIELWCKEAPKACRNFIQLCLEGYYIDCIFHRVVPGFMAQTGDPSGTGDGGESIYGEPFRDEFHSRLRFVRRGLLAMANAGRHDNGSQFFFTFAPAPELQNKHTIFGKVSGTTLFNMLKLEDGEFEGDRPLYPHKILKAEVLLNPFDDIAPRKVQNSDRTAQDAEKAKPKAKSSATKNFKLLSFGDEAEEDEQETDEASRVFTSKSKSSHDLTDDPRLSATPAVDPAVSGQPEGSRDTSSSLESVRKKLKTDTTPSGAKVDNYRLFHDEKNDAAEKLAQTKVEYAELKRSMLKSKQQTEVAEQKEEEKKKKKVEQSSAVSEYHQELERFSRKKKQMQAKGASREEQTMAMLKKFQNKLFEAKEAHGEEKTKTLGDDEEIADDDDTWMWHRLEAERSAPVLARDANTKQDDWYDIHDPRNEMNKRRREAAKQR